jgi:prepilin-type N-terminal cleavage/methylation domain-containing protein/prepilin-type processing-associated H-X9-DG protein
VNAPKARKSAFTLVELLVVIGIIAVLVGILLPVLGNVRRTAAKAKCAVQMRELGTAMVMYAQENKGHLPPVRLNTKYNVDGILYDKNGPEVAGKSVDENVKWWHFIGRYITKQRVIAQDANDSGRLRQSVFWCQSFEGYVDSGNANNLQGGVNRNATGIGMNAWPNFTPSFPPSGVDLLVNSSPQYNGKPVGFFDCVATNPVNRGVWYKLSHFTRPAERVLLADSRQFYLEAKAVSGLNIPGQRLLFIKDDYSSGVSGQSMYDFYRHGQYPPVQNNDKDTGYHNAKGGKIGYNILFADNHVESPPDRETGYRVARLRFPEP